MTPELLGTIGVYLSAAMSTVGFLGYVVTARFWHSRGGWHVFWYMATITWVLDMAVIRFLFGDAPWFDWLRVTTFAVGMPLVLGWRSWIIFDLQLWDRLRRLVAYGGTDSHLAAEEETHGT